MALYKVEVKVAGRELYWVNADSEKEALENWHDGDIFLAEMLDAEPVSATEETQP